MQHVTPECPPNPVDVASKPSGRKAARRRLRIQAFSRTSNETPPARRVARRSCLLLASAIRTNLRSSRISATRWARDRRSILEDRLVALNLHSIVSSNAEIRVAGVNTPVTIAGCVAAKRVSSSSRTKSGKDTTVPSGQPVIVLSRRPVWTATKGRTFISKRPVKGEVIKLVWINQPRLHCTMIFLLATAPKPAESKDRPELGFASTRWRRGRLLCQNRAVAPG